MPPLLLLGPLPALVVVATTPLRAADASIAVTTTADELSSDGDCSLREAVRTANTNLAVDGCAVGRTPRPTPSRGRRGPTR